MFWKFIRHLPKLALVIGVLVASTGIFIWWRLFRSPPVREQAAVRQVQEEVKIQKTAADVAKRIYCLLLVGSDLFDAETGELFFANWLHGDNPNQIFWDSESQKIIGDYGNRYARYSLDGRREASLGSKFGSVFSRDLKTAYFSTDKDIWKANVDWKNWKLTNEVKITSSGLFNDQFFTGNVLAHSNHAMIVRSTTALLRVDLDSGAIRPMRIPFIKDPKQVSPDGRSIVAEVSNQFICYDMDSDSQKNLVLGRGNLIADCHWLDNDQCLCISTTKSVSIYNREKHELAEIMALPGIFQKIEAVAPNGKALVCTAQRSAVLVNLETKTAEPILNAYGFTWINDDSIVYARDMPDSTSRGTWLQSLVGEERRLCEEPFLIQNKTAPVVMIPSVQTLAFCTRKGAALILMNPSGVPRFLKTGNFGGIILAQILRGINLGNN